jgi:hypothetical protein
VIALRARLSIACRAGLLAGLLGLCCWPRAAVAQQPAPPAGSDPGPQAQAEAPLPSGVEQTPAAPVAPVLSGGEPRAQPAQGAQEAAPAAPVEQQMAVPAEPPAPGTVPPRAPATVEPPTGLPAIPRVSYEWQRTARLLAKQGLAVDSAPQGKRIAFIRIVRDDVFVEDELWPTWLNWLHGRTRESVVRRELLFEEGIPYDEARIEETMRNLRGMAIFALVRIVAVTTGKPGEVGVLVHTRDIWSLRFEQDFSTTGNTLNTLLLRGTELNTFGHNKSVSADVTLLPKSYTIAQSYYARRVLGSSLALTQRAGLVFERASRQVEGNLWSLRLEQPYYSLKQRVAWLARYERDDRVVRAVQDGVVLTFPEETGYPGPYTQWKYRRALDRGSLLGGVRVGERVKHAFSGGWDYRNQVARSIAVPAELQEAFALHVLPKERRESGPSLSYEFFTPTWVTFENLSTYGKSENVQTGPHLLLSTRLPVKALGSSTNSWVVSSEAGWTLAPRGALIDMRASISGRYEGAAFVDQRTVLLLRGASPTFSVLRLVGSISFDLRKRDTQNTFVTLGGDGGLRGYPSQAFRGFGVNRAVANFELRTLPLQWRAVQLGGVVFYDVGAVYENLAEFRAHHAVGVGARLLFPQLNRYPFTFDAGMSFDPGFRFVPTTMGGQFVPITAAEDPP